MIRKIKLHRPIRSDLQTPLNVETIEQQCVTTVQKHT